MLKLHPAWPNAAAAAARKKMQKKTRSVCRLIMSSQKWI
jgi:hypothetical protein